MELVILFGRQQQIQPLIRAGLNIFVFFGLAIPGGTLAWMTGECPTYRCSYGELELQAAAAFILVTW